MPASHPKRSRGFRRSIHRVGATIARIALGALELCDSAFSAALYAVNAVYRVIYSCVLIPIRKLQFRVQEVEWELEARSNESSPASSDDDRSRSFSGSPERSPDADDSGEDSPRWRSGPGDG